MASEQTHVVITGAGGFIGNFLSARLAQHGFQVTAVKRQPFAGARIDGLSWRQADLTQADSLPQNFDVLVHCAAEIPSRCPDATLLYARNMDASRSVFRQAERVRAKKVVFLSSMSVYGRVSDAIVTEETMPDRPDPYGRAKLDAEVFLSDLARGGAFSALTLRLPGTVGRGSHGNFLSEALKLVLRGEKVIAKNPESLFNNIVYVGDLASFLQEWMISHRFGCTLTNLAAQDPLSVRELVRLLFRLTNRPEQVSFETGGKKPFMISLDRAMSLGYKPSTVEASVEAMVRDCLAPG